MEIRLFSYSDYDNVINLWEQCRLLQPWQDPEIDIERILQHDGSLFLIAEVDKTIVGSVIGAYDGYSATTHYLAVLPEYRKRGIANALINRLEKKLIARGCSRLNVLIPAHYDLLISMYERLGYETDNVVCVTKKLIER